MLILYQQKPTYELSVWQHENGSTLRGFENSHKMHRFTLQLISAFISTGWPKKVSHYQVSSLNRIKNRY